MPEERCGPSNRYQTRLRGPDSKINLKTLRRVKEKRTCGGNGWRREDQRTPIAGGTRPKRRKEIGLERERRKTNQDNRATSRGEPRKKREKRTNQELDCKPPPSEPRRARASRRKEISPNENEKKRTGEPAARKRGGCKENGSHCESQEDGKR